MDSSDDTRMWFRCTRCKHTAMIDRSGAKSRNGSAQKLDRKSAVEYEASKTFDVGQTIYHSTWDDLGLVVSKSKTSGGVQAIMVTFEKSGERKLIENIGADSFHDSAA